MDDGWKEDGVERWMNERGEAMKSLRFDKGI